MQAKLAFSIYGVNTGFGGSADTRTDAPNSLQISLLEHQLAGVLPRPTEPNAPLTFDVTDPMSLTMPEAIVRGAMVVRINSLVRCIPSSPHALTEPEALTRNVTYRGHSGVRLEVLETLQALLNKNITPMVPLRGSISASGDLQPVRISPRAPLTRS